MNPDQQTELFNNAVAAGDDSNNTPPSQSDCAPTVANSDDRLSNSAANIVAQSVAVETAKKPPTQPYVYTVSRLNRNVRELIESRFPKISVRGEISNLATPPSGHIYFALKDNKAQVRCAFFRKKNRGGPALENGMEVLLQAEVSLYEGRGEYQLIVTRIEQQGEGALLLAFEQLKARLQEEGLFAAEHKQALPLYPDTIGVITSPAGAAIRDVISVLRRRYPAAKLLLYPVQVQGKQAHFDIAETIAQASLRHECDVLLLVRGGGSLEDLAAFNEEAVARAIYDCKLPLVTGIGHEVDFTIADFVADKRGATPSAAAELISPNEVQLQGRVQSQGRQLTQILQRLLVQERKHLQASRLPRLDVAIRSRQQKQDEYGLRLQHLVQQKMADVQRQLARLRIVVQQQNPVPRLHLRRQSFAHLRTRLYSMIRHRVQQKIRSFEIIHTQLQYWCENTALLPVRQKLHALGRELHTCSPRATLDRGYAIVRRPDGTVIHAASMVAADERIIATVAKGDIHARVEKMENG